MVGGWAEKGKEIKNTNSTYKISCGDAMYSMGSKVNNIVITMHNDRWLLGLLW